MLDLKECEKPGKKMSFKGIRSSKVMSFKGIRSS